MCSSSGNPSFTQELPQPPIPSAFLQETYSCAGEILSYHKSLSCSSLVRSGIHRNSSKPRPLGLRTSACGAPMTAIPRTPSLHNLAYNILVLINSFGLPSSNTHYNPAHDCRMRRSEPWSLKVKHTTWRHDSCFTLTPSASVAV